MTFHQPMTGAESAQPPVFHDIIALPKSGLVLSFTTLPDGRRVAVGKLARRAS